MFKKESKLRWLKRHAAENDTAYMIGGKDADLPLAVQSLLGLKTANGSFSGDTLARRNDYRNQDFGQIADLIEEHAEELGVSA